MNGFHEILGITTTTTLHPFNGSFIPRQPGYAGKTSLDLNEARDDMVLVLGWIAVASAGLYANNLHLARDR